MLIGGVFGCVSIMRPKGPISGYRLKVATEFARPSGPKGRNEALMIVVVNGLDISTKPLS